MIVFRYLNREVARAFIAILTILFLVAFSQRALHYLGALTSGEISSWALLQLLLLFVPTLASLLLPLTLFVAILMTLGRLYIEQEMHVLRAAGVSERDVFRHFLPPVLALSVGTAFITLWAMPWSLEQQLVLRAEEAARAELNLLSPGRFQETKDKRSVIYVHERSADNALAGVLLITLPGTEQQSGKKDGQKDAQKGGPERAQVVAANAGSHFTRERDGSRYLVLEQGRRYELEQGRPDWSVTEFERYFVRTQGATAAEPRRLLKAKSSGELLNAATPGDWAELQWRISLPLSIPILALLAIPLCRVRPREGKFARVLPGLLIYVLYLGGVMVLRTAIEQERWPVWLGVWPLHAVVVLGAWWLLTAEERQLRQKKTPATLTTE